MNIMGLIPARAGSERVPGKNYADLGGKPLIRWTIDAAKKFPFELLAVTTDDPTIKEIALEVGCSVISRPPELAQASTPMLPVVQHAVDIYQPDVVVLLQPTSPFRNINDIEKCVEILKASRGDSVVSVTQAPEDVVFELGHADRMRPSKKLFTPNGAVYVVTTEELARRGNFYSGVCYAYRMPKDRSLDVDTHQDLEMARHLVRMAQAA